MTIIQSLKTLIKMKKQITTSVLLIAVLSIIISINTHAAIVFTKAGSPYYFTEDYIITNSDTIIIEAGTTIILSPAVNLITNGTLIINGTTDEPVSLLPEIEGIGWGKIQFDSPGKTSRMKHAVIVDGSIISHYCNMVLEHVDFINNQNLPWNNPVVFVINASVNIKNSSIRGSYSGEGFQMLNSEEVLVKNCFFSKIPDAVELTNVVGGYISHNYFEDIPDDAIDLNNCTNTLIDSNIIINAADRGIELGSENNGNSENIILKRNVLINCKTGVIFKEDSYGQVINNTFYGDTVGIRCIEDNAPKAGSYVNIQNCIFSNSVEMDVYHDLNSIVNIDYCLSDKEQLPGNHNILADPLFLDVSDYNFNLQEDSPCINAGNPDLPLDPNNTISDIGAYYYNTDTTGINEHNEVLNSLQIYPNPFEDEFTISWQGINSNLVSVSLFDLSGIMLPINTKKEQYAVLNRINVIPLTKLESNMVVICKITVVGNSSSYLLIHR